MNTLLPIFCTFFHVTYILLHIKFSRKCINLLIAQSGVTRIFERNHAVLKMSVDARKSGKFASKYSQFRISVEEEKGGEGGGGKQTNNGSSAFKDRLQKTRPGQNSPSVIILEHNSPFDENTFV